MPLAAPLTATVVEPDLPVRDSAIFDSIAAILTPEAVKTHLETIITRCGDLMRRLREPSLPEEGVGKLAEAAHTLAGSAGMFGFKRLALASRYYERAMETESGETPTLIESLIAALESTLPELEREAAQTGREVLPDTETVTPFLAEAPELRSAAPQAARRVPVGTEAQSSTPSLTDAISAVRRDFAAEVANTPELILEAQRLRYQVYCVERGFEKSDNGIEQDEFDIHSRHIVLRRRSDGEITGTTRVVLYDPNASGDSYPMQHVCAASLLHGLPMETTAELSRFAISKQLRGSSPALIRLALIEGLFRISHELGLTDWCAVMENSLLRLLKSSAIHFRPLGPLVEYHGLRQPCCANIKEIAARMQVERPEIWAFVTHNGQYYGSAPEVIFLKKPHNIARGWRATVSKSAEFAFFPNFESAVININAPPQYYRPLTLAAHGSLVAP
jgi:N-acyl-L-homoserine lactone synthetase/HPt (histidine-containing phosphotransfer) domain-containing protein